MDVKVENLNCDENGTMKLQVLFDLLMKACDHQLAKTKISGNALASKNWGWVVTQYEGKIDRLPRFGEIITIKTNDKGFNRFFCYRDFDVYDAENNLLLSLSSRWVMFDLEKRKLIPTQTELLTSQGYEALDKLPKFKRLRKQDAYISSRPYRARYDDLDLNHHVTNSHYFSWMIDMYDRDFLKKHELTSLAISFDQEVRYGDEINSLFKLENDTAYHQIFSNDHENSVCELTWKER